MYSVLINKQMQACHINNTLVYTTLLYMTRIKHCVPIQVTRWLLFKNNFSKEVETTIDAYRCVGIYRGVSLLIFSGLLTAAGPLPLCLPLKGKIALSDQP